MDLSGKELLKLLKKNGWQVIRKKGSITMIKVYPAIIHNDDDGLWLEFPDLNGCYTQGESVEELMENAEEALGSFLAVKMECEEKMPKASSIEDIQQESNCSKTYVSVDVNKYHRDTKAVRKMISIPAWLAQEAEKRNYSLSKILQETLLGKIDIA